MNTSIVRFAVVSAMASLLSAASIQAQSITAERIASYIQTGAGAVNPRPNPYTFEFHVRGGLTNITQWGPAFYKAGSGGTTAQGASNATNTGTLNFSTAPNNGSDFMFVHSFANAAALVAAYPIAPTEGGQYGVKFVGANPPTPSTFTAGLVFATGATYPTAVPQITAINNGATWSGGRLRLSSSGVTTLTLNSFPEYSSTTYGSLIGAGIYKSAGGVVAQASVESYYIPSLGANQPPITQLTVDSDWFEAGEEYTLELQYGVIASDPAEGFPNGVNFQGLAAYYTNTVVTLLVPPTTPVFTAHPMNRAVTRGHPVSFISTASGGGLTYQWRKNGVNLTNGGRISGANSATLVISDATDADVAGYSVVITNSAGTATSNTAVLKVVGHSLYNDFNGDGAPDVMLENTATGQRTLWLMGGPNNAFVKRGLDLGFLNADWHIAASADFNGDKRPDIVLENRVSGQRTLWIMGGENNQFVTAGLDLGVLDPAWHIVGAWDFNSNGSPDLLLENVNTGQRTLYLMGGPNNQIVQQGIDMGFLAVDWHFVGVADFDGNGRPDILLENRTTGQRVLWIMTGSNSEFVSEAIDMGFLPPAWKIVATADFNGDAAPDVLLENSTTGQRTLWLMGGPKNSVVLEGLDLGFLNANWHIVR